eukprot:1179526-Prorocentrum_minimum.AAC.1
MLEAERTVVQWFSGLQWYGRVAQSRDTSRGVPEILYASHFPSPPSPKSQINGGRVEVFSGERLTKGAFIMGASVTHPSTEYAYLRPSITP